jgi:foldase protein PrsA
MRNKMLLALLAVMVFVLSVSSFAAETKAEAFDQDAALQKFWKSPDSTVVGTVNGMPITKGDVMKAMWFWAGPNMLQELMNQKMIWQAANKSSVKFTSDDMKSKIDEQLKRMGASDVDKVLAQSGMTRDRFMTVTKVSGLVEKIVAKDIKVTDTEYAEYVNAQHILIRAAQDQKDKTKAEEAAKAKADEIYAKVKAGEDFSKLADEYSEDPGNVRDGKKNGGNLGWFTHGRMVQDFENAAFALKPGEVSEPVKTFYGYHIIKLVANGKDATPAEKDEIKNMIMSQKVPMETGIWFQELKASTKMDNKLMAPVVQQPKPQVRPEAKPRITPRPAPKPAPAPAPAPAAGETETPPPPPAPEAP